MRHPDTERHYRHAWNQWQHWCTEEQIDPMAPDVDALGCYVLELADRYAPPIVGQHLAGIVAHHLDAGAETSPGQSRTVRAIMRGVRAGDRKPHAKLGLRTVDYRRLLQTCDDGKLAGQRDGAMIALLWAGYFRASEICELDTAHVVMASGNEIKLRYDNRYITIRDNPPSRAVSHLVRWLQAGGIVSGRLFRRINKAGKVQDDRLTEHGVRVRLKHRIKQIGLNADRYSGMSMRKGSITESYRRGMPVHKLVKVARLRDATAAMNNVSPEVL